MFFIYGIYGKDPRFSTKLVPEKNLLVWIKNPLFIAKVYVFHACLRTSPLSTLLVAVQFLLVLDNWI